jgi:unsaturated rhamnogalacturonyl hydrolase
MTGVELDSGRTRAAGDLLTRYPFALWSYGESVGLEGLLAASSLLADPGYAGFAHGLLKGWSARATPYRAMENTIAGHALCEVFEHTGDAALVEAGRRAVDNLSARRRIGGVFAAFEESPLDAPYGGARLPADEAALLAHPGAGVFVDCMHFDPPFFVHFGALTGDAALLDLGIDQALGHVDLLQDPSGLFWHFWLERTERRYGLGWGRGQGWALLGLLDVLEQAPAEHGGRPRVLEAFVRLSEALRATQMPDGSWPAVAHDAQSGSESSTAAFAAAGFARGVRLGLLDASFAEPARRAWARVVANVDADGLLVDVSAAVRPSTHESSYRHVPKGFLVPWGQGSLLVAAQAMSELG